ncbi:CPBP family intramembrane glutamic endopeptidase [Latilactobacillus graminis]|uniref:CAAX amino terminal protease family protein n=2 Tax=Latilactobacillus graminis TaxID=60519 RepID=A0AA89I740_9LACO|nr:type II CAAX endopeptidase family protein [Latilactobacillus graminis]KRM24379.1 CAAX amino terminal protease family protein [Latilactobacillus graminis DSM 20719]QFP80070.1 CPBP family intramembrane metalloprotease [Latilactobacillus graminis]
MIRDQENSTIIISYLLTLLIPSALIRWGHLSVTFFLLTTIVDCLGAIWLLYLNQRTATNSLEQRPLKHKSILIWGLCGIVLTLLVQMLASIFEQNILHVTAKSLNTISLMSSMKKQPFLILATTIAAPVMEEITFRKALFGGLANHLNDFIAAIIASLLFAFLHQDGHLLIYTAIGLFLCWLYRKTGSIFSTIISHAGMNLMVTLLYFSH